MIVEITPQNLQETILNNSSSKGIVIYIYNPNDPNAEQFTNTLTATVGTESTVTIAKVDITNPELQGLAYQLQISELPALAVVANGRVTNMLQGDDAIKSYKTLIDPLMPQKDEILYKEALDNFNDKNYNGALTKIDEAIEINPLPLYKATKADVYVKQNKFEEAENIINSLTMQDKLDITDYVNSLISAIALGKKSLDDSPIEELKQKVNADPNNFDLKIELAMQYNKINQKNEALDCLYEILKKDLNYKDAKKTYLEIIATMGANADSSKYRRKLYSLMY